MRSNLLRAFKAIDTDGGGTIDKHELLDALRDPIKVDLLLRGTEALRPLTKPGMYMTLFNALDTDGDEEVTFGEFERFCLHLVMQTSTLTHVLRDIFDKVDTDHSGAIDEKELSAALQSDDTIKELIHHGRCADVLRPLLECGHNVKEVFLAMDDDGNGEVDWDEFRDFFVDTAVRVSGVIESIRMVFNLIDTDRSGAIDREELRSALNDSDRIAKIAESSRDLRPLLDPRNVDSWFQLMDVDGDGKFFKRNKIMWLHTHAAAAHAAACTRLPILERFS